MAEYKEPHFTREEMEAFSRGMSRTNEAITKGKKTAPAKKATGAKKRGK